MDKTSKIEENDGLLMNFAFDDTFTLNTATRVTGKWKARLKAKRVERRIAEASSIKTTPTKNVAAIESTSISTPSLTQLSPTQTTEPSRLSVSVSTPAQTSNEESIVHTNNIPASSSIHDNSTILNSVQETSFENVIEVSNELWFNQLGLSSKLVNQLTSKLGLSNPTSVQEYVIPRLLSSTSDTLIIGETGSGKTLAYLLPIIHEMMKIDVRTLDDQHDQRVSKMNRHSGLFTLILVPTHELCQQIMITLEEILGCAVNIVAGSVTGGENRSKEKARIRKGLNILVATPGRLVDHLENTRAFNVGLVRWLIIDEGDRIMEMGFGDNVGKILHRLNTDWQTAPDTLVNLPKRRRTVVCTATLKRSIRKLGNMSLKDWTMLRLPDRYKPEAPMKDESENVEDFKVPRQLRQSWIACPAKLRLLTLIAVLRRAIEVWKIRRTIVFFSTADSVNFHFSLLTQTAKHSVDSSSPSTTHNNQITGKYNDASLVASNTFAYIRDCLFRSQDVQVEVCRLHGSLEHSVRRETLRKFAGTGKESLSSIGQSTHGILFTTDLASRGLDIAQVDLVVEYDAATSLADHIHRVGRTARAGRVGRAIVFLTRNTHEEGYVHSLQKCCGYTETTLANRTVNTIQREDAEAVLRATFSRNVNGSTNGGDGEADWKFAATQVQVNLEHWTDSSKQRRELAARAFQSYVRAYSTHTANQRAYFNKRELHLGHVCKAFTLKLPPRALRSLQCRVTSGTKRKRDTGNEARPNIRTGEKGIASVRKKFGLSVTKTDVEEFNVG